MNPSLATTIRLTTRFDQEVVTTLRLESGLSVAVVVVEASTVRLTASVDGSLRGVLRVGTRLQVHMSSERLLGDLEMKAIVVSLQLDGDSLRCTGEYLVPPAERAGFECNLHRAFNERRAYRVEPDAADAIEVDVMSNDARPRHVLASLADLSVLGIGLRVSQEQAKLLAAGMRVRVGFTLPGDRCRVEVDAEVRDCSRFTSLARVGLAFEFKNTDHAARRAVTRYVMARQVEARRNGTG